MNDSKQWYASKVKYKRDWRRVKILLLGLIFILLCCVYVELVVPRIGYDAGFLQGLTDVRHIAIIGGLVSVEYIIIALVIGILLFCFAIALSVFFIISHARKS